MCTRISFTPSPTLGNGLLSDGSPPRWTRHSSKPTRLRASSAKPRTRWMLSPSQMSGLGVIISKPISRIFHTACPSPRPSPEKSARRPSSTCAGCSSFAVPSPRRTWRAAPLPRRAHSAREPAARHLQAAADEVPQASSRPPLLRLWAGIQVMVWYDDQRAARLFLVSPIRQSNKPDLVFPRHWSGNHLPDGVDNSGYGLVVRGEFPLQ